MINYDFQVQKLLYKLTTFITISYILLSFPVQKTLANRKEIIDVISDIKFGWKVKGDFIYFPIGSQLKGLPEKLPQEFSFNSITETRGIWAIFPNSEHDSILNATSYSKNEASFSFSTSALLLDSVTVRHNSGGGNATINIITSHHNYTQTPERTFSGWIDITVSLEGTNRFTIEANANTEHDYILIDRIEATYLETTTSTRSPKPSTTTPEPKPKSGASTLGVFKLFNYLLSFFNLFILFGAIYHS